jgi:uncharacterized lipoprotein YmbA
MRARCRALLPPLLLGLTLCGCVSLKRSEEARFFVLRSFPRVAAQAEILPGAVGVMEVRLPGHLERPQIVTEAGPNELRIDEFVRWAEPLGPATTRVLVENLAGRLPERLVLEAPWRSGTELLCRVVLDVESFAPQADGSVRLVGRWALQAPDSARALALRGFNLERGPVPVRSSGVDATAAAAAMSELLAELSDQIAAAVRELPAPPIAEPQEPAGSSGEASSPGPLQPG